MDVLHERYLSCHMDVALVPGPASLHPPYMSIEQYEITCYNALDVVTTFNHLEQVSVTRQGSTQLGDDGWSLWRWRWRTADRWIDFDFTLFDDEAAGCWGGSGLSTHCTYADLVRLWLNVKVVHPDVWLHDANTALHTPHSFLTEYALPPLRQALEDRDREVREGAQDSWAVYVTLGLQPSVV